MASLYFDTDGTEAAICERPASNPNGPFNNPVANLDKVLFHTKLDYLEVAATGNRTIAFPKVTKGSADSIAEYGPDLSYGVRQQNWTLITHNLGYLPFVIVVVNGEVIPAGFPVQSRPSDGSQRIVTPYVTTSQVKLREVANVSSKGLDAQSVSFEILVFKVPSGKSDFILEPGRMRVGTFDSRKRYVRVAKASETNFLIAKGRTIDLDHGAARTVTPKGKKLEDRPPKTYRGSFTGTGSVAIAVGTDRENDRTEVDMRTGAGIEVWDDGHLVFSTERKLISVFQTLSLSGRTIEFAEPGHDYIYFERAASILGGYQVQADSYASVIPGERTTLKNLAALNSDQGDFALVLARFEQVKTPDKVGDPGWLRTPRVVIPQNQWIPMNGSGLLESDYFNRRAVTFEVSGDALRARVQQSIPGIKTGRTKGDDDLGTAAHYTTFDKSKTHTEMPMRKIAFGSKTGTSISEIQVTGGFSEGGSKGLKTTFKWKWGSTWKVDLIAAIGRVN
ncbi:MAG: hypothetical protein H6873_05670 [Hyphomicrobiaceae bacterium]|nr:hypothetical protein [Hyphomicrobiaceae bacterium]